MRTVYSYARLVIAGWLFVGGLALQFTSSPASAERYIRWRDREHQTLTPDQRAKSLQYRDETDERNEWSWRIFGVFLAGIGFAVGLHEAAYVCAQYQRAPRTPTD